MNNSAFHKHPDSGMYEEVQVTIMQRIHNSIRVLHQVGAQPFADEVIEVPDVQPAIKEPAGEVAEAADIAGVPPGPPIRQPPGVSDPQHFVSGRLALVPSGSQALAFRGRPPPKI